MRFIYLVQGDKAVFPYLLPPGRAAQSDNLRQCYAEMVHLDIFPEQKLRLVDLWL